jgi:hypothetical protein
VCVVVLGLAKRCDSRCQHCDTFLGGHVLPSKAVEVSGDDTDVNDATDTLLGEHELPSRQRDDKSRRTDNETA